jgi:hypothetical protein
MYLRIMTLGNGYAGTQGGIVFRNFNTIGNGREEALISWRKRDGTQSSHNDFQLLTYSTPNALTWLRHLFVNGETGEIRMQDSMPDPNRATRYPVRIRYGLRSQGKFTCDTVPTVTVPSYFLVPYNDTLARVTPQNAAHVLGKVDSALMADSAKHLRGLSDSLRTKKIVVGVAPDTSVFDSTGISRFGNARQWNDVADMKLTSIKGAGSAGEPTWAPTGLGFNLNRFAIGDSMQGDCELTHEFVQGDSSDIHLHYHVNGSNIDARHVGATVDVDFFNANGDSVVYHYRGNIYDTIPANTRHMSQRLCGTARIATPGVNIGAKIYGTVIRIAHETAPTSNPFFSTLGMHHRIDSDGSRGVYTK